MASQVTPSAFLTDDELVERVRIGQDAAFFTLVSRYESRVYAIALHMGGDAAIAERIVQDAFLTAHRELGLLGPRLDFGTWLWGVVAQVALSEARRWPSPPPSRGRTPLADVLSRLDPLDRLAWLLTDLEGLSGESVAWVFEESPLEVKRRTHRVRLMLCPVFAELEREASPRREAASRTEVTRRSARHAQATK